MMRKHLVHGGMIIAFLLAMIPASVQAQIQTNLATVRVFLFLDYDNDHSTAQLAGKGYTVRLYGGNIDEKAVTTAPNSEATFVAIPYDHYFVSSQFHTLFYNWECLEGRTVDESPELIALYCKITGWGIFLPFLSSTIAKSSESSLPPPQQFMPFITTGNEN